MVEIIDQLKPIFETLARYGIFDIGGIALAGFLTWLVLHLDRKRKKREEEFYELQTKSNVHEILKHFVEIDRISNIELSEGEELSEKDESQILLALNRYYKQNYRKMNMLLENINISLSRWSGLNSSNRSKYDEIIKDFTWLVNDYFSISKPENIQHRMWNTQYKDVTNKRYKIDQTIDVLLK